MLIVHFAVWRKINNFSPSVGAEVVVELITPVIRAEKRNPNDNKLLYQMTDCSYDCLD